MTTDGRLARSEKQQEAIKKALMKLVRAGNYAPSAVEVANETGITVRTVFRHFANREKFYASISEHIRKEALAMVGTYIRSDDLHGRLEEAIEARMKIFEQILPFAQFQFVNRHQSSFLRETHKNDLQENRMLMRMAYAGLIEISGPRFDALELALSIANWRTLRFDFGKSPDEAKDLVIEIARSLYPDNVTAVAPSPAP